MKCSKASHRVNFCGCERDRLATPFVTRPKRDGPTHGFDYGLIFAR